MAFIAFRNEDTSSRIGLASYPLNIAICVDPVVLDLLCLDSDLDPGVICLVIAKDGLMPRPSRDMADSWKYDFGGVARSLEPRLVESGSKDEVLFESSPVDTLSRVSLVERPIVRRSKLFRDRPDFNLFGLHRILLQDDHIGSLTVLESLTDLPDQPNQPRRDRKVVY